MATRTTAKKTATHKSRTAAKGPHKAKKAPAKKTAAKKAPAKKKAVKRAALELKPIKEKMSKSELALWLSEQTEVPKKQVVSVLAALSEAMKASIMPRGCGEFQVPGVIAIVTRKVPARKVPAIKKGTMVRNVRTGEEQPHPGRAAYVKPATVKVRARALGGLKRAALGTE